VETFNRICIQDFSIKDKRGEVLILKRGEEYLTSTEEEGKVTVFTQFWVKVPSSIFAGEIKFT